MGAQSSTLTPFESGKSLLDQLTATRMNAIIDAINRAQPIAGDNLFSQKTSGGIILRGKSKGAGGTSVTDISFYPTDATETIAEVTSNKVAFIDGKVNGEFPTGMGGGDFVFDVDNPEDATIFVGITFDSDTLEITSRFFQEAASGDWPENRIDEDGTGHFFWPMCFTYIDDDNFIIHSLIWGDLTVNFAYGMYNGVPALFIDGGAYSAWVELPDEV